MTRTSTAPWRTRVSSSAARMAAVSDSAASRRTSAARACEMRRAAASATGPAGPATITVLPATARLRDAPPVRVRATRTGRSGTERTRARAAAPIGGRGATGLARGPELAGLPARLALAGLVLAGRPQLVSRLGLLHRDRLGALGQQVDGLAR